MATLITRGCFKRWSIQTFTRKYRNVIGFILVALATILILQGTFGKQSILNLRILESTKTFQALRNERHSTIPAKDNIKQINAAIDSKVTPSCYPDDLKPDNIKTPFKFFIYNLPSKYNYDIQKRMSMDKEYAYCYDLMYCGAGKELNQYSNIQGKSLFLPPLEEGRDYSNSTMSLRDTHQFSLEVIIHYKLLHSKYRTLDPKKADIFYIPAYTGLKCLEDRSGANTFIERFFDYLKTNESKYFNSGKPHFSTLSKIQREQGSNLCTTLRQSDSRNITYIAIEKESNPGWTDRGYIFGKSIIVAPYPSYIHFAGVKHDKTLLEYQGKLTQLRTSKFRLNVPTISNRNVLLFLAAGSRRSNHFRAQIIDQFPFKTQGNYEEYIKEHSNIIKRSNFSDSHQVMLITNECSQSHRTTTIPWMVNSKFCVQPPGDSPTRKSFYDAILSGCIPIIFQERYQVTLPFQDFLNYTQFTVTIPAKMITSEGQKIIDIIRQIPLEKVRELHENLVTVAKWFQYSLSDGTFQEDDDAVTLILQQIRNIYKL